MTTTGEKLTSGDTDQLCCGDQFAWTYLKRSSDYFERPESRVDLRAFDLSDMVSVQPRPLPQLLLRHASLLAGATNSDTKRTMQRRPGHPTQAAVLTRRGLPVKTGRLRPLVPALTVALALLLLSGCGGTKTPANTTATPGEARSPASSTYPAGIQQWSMSMLNPALQISSIFTNQQSLNALLSGDASARKSLTVPLSALKACSQKLARLGMPPPQYAPARNAAKAACAHFEGGAGLIEIGLDAAGNGLGSGLLTRGANQISDGMNGIATAVRRTHATR